MATSKQFRDDLLFRVNQVELKLPPLRERKEDIADLVQLFLQQSGNAEKSFSAEALALVKEYPWPGNIRQLEKVVTVLGALTEGLVISKADLERQLNLGGPKSSQTQNTNEVYSIAPDQVQGRFQTNVEELEKSMLQFALKHCKNESEAARFLGIPRNSLIRRMREWGNSRKSLR